MSMATWAVIAAIAASVCRLGFRLAALLVAYRLALKVRDLDAVTKVADLASTLGGEPLRNRLRRAPRARRAVGGDSEAQQQ